MNITILHNPRCSKSRQTLQLLEEKGIQPTIIEYLKTPPSREELAAIHQKLGGDIVAMMRTNEDEFKAQELGALDGNDQKLLDAMAATPKLIERPIVINGNKAKIGRPPESVLEII